MFKRRTGPREEDQACNQDTTSGAKKPDFLEASADYWGCESEAADYNIIAMVQLCVLNLVRCGNEMHEKRRKRWREKYWDGKGTVP